MEFKERIEKHRSKLEQNVDVEKLYPLLQQHKAITKEEIAQIECLSSKQAKVGKLLDLLLSKDKGALQSFYLVLQTMYQHILTSMFREPQFTSTRNTKQDSCSTILTSDSDDDMSRVKLQPDLRPMEFGARSKMTKIIPSHQYDPNSTMSSSYPGFSEHLSPGSASVERQSPVPVSPTDALGKYGHPPDKGYEWFFKQFEHAFNELQVLKQQNAEMIDMRDRYDQVTSELLSLKSQQGELHTEKQQLLEEISNLQKLRNEDKQELSELRHQQRKAASENGTSDGLLDKFESMHKDYDLLREQYAEMVAARNAALSRLDTTTEENNNLRGQMEEMRTKIDSLSLERNGLKQQCTNAIREWNQALIKHSEVNQRLNMVIKQRDDFCKDFNQTFAKHVELKKNFEALRTEKDAAVKEYALVMSERDTVHKEIEQLQDKLGSVNKHAELTKGEKKSLETELESLRREMASISSERDKYRRERNDMSGINQHERIEFQMRMEQQRDLARKERNEAYEKMDQIIKETQKEKAEEMDSVNKESESLKKQFDKLQLDFENAEQEAENANKNRDKAFSERDKIVQERESIRSLCDSLRRDRDRAVSDLAQSLRDCDEFKRQKNEAVKELKEIKCRYEAMVEKDTRRQHFQYIGHNHSRDSAIDADLQDLGAETVEISVELEKSDPAEIGFEVVGGKDEPQFPNDPSIFVSHITKGGVADGKLRVNDTILRVNNLDTVNTDKRTVIQALWKSSSGASLLVRRRKSTAARVWQPVQLVVSCQKGAESGIQIDQGLYITRICPGGVVAKYGMLPCVGDRIVNINNISGDSLNPRDAMRMLENSSDSVVLDIWRQSSPLNSAGSSPTPTSTGVNSPLPEGITVSSPKSKSDTLAVRSSSWETPSDTSRSAGSSKNLRSSGSQTDSLDSPGPSPRKSLRNQEHDKVRHSMPMLDKAKERMEKILRSRHRSQEREKDSEEKKKREIDETQQRSVYEQTNSKAHHKPVEDCGTQVNLAQFNLPSTENVIAEFPNNTVYTKVAATSQAPLGSSVVSPCVPKSPRKRELELDSNSGTWPKTRGQHAPLTSGPPTVTFPPGQKPFKERPSIRDVFYRNPDHVGGSGSVFDRTVSSGPTIHHSAQNSDSSIKYPNTSYPSSSPSMPPSSSILSPTTAAMTVASAFSPTNSSINPVFSKPVHSNNMPLPLSSTITSTPLTSSTIPSSTVPTNAVTVSKPQSYFTVGFMHEPGPHHPHPQPHGHRPMPSRGAPVFNKPTAGPMYGTLPSNRPSGGTQRGSRISPPHMNIPGVAPIPTDFRFDSATLPGHRQIHKGTQSKPRRPTSAPHKADRHWQTSPSAAMNWSNGRVATESPVNHSHVPQQAPLGSMSSRLASQAPTGHVSPVTVLGPSGPYQVHAGGPTAPHQALSSPPAYSGRPGSLEVPQPHKILDNLSEPLERHRYSSPVGPTPVNRASQYYQSQHPSPAIRSSPLSASSQHPSLSSPLGSYASDVDHDRPVSFHGAPGERYSSPSPSQRSYSTFDRSTPTINEELYAARFSCTSPRSRAFLEEDNRQTAFTKRDKVMERIRIPSSTSVNTKSGSVEIVSERSSPSSPLFHLDSHGSLKYKCSPSSDEYIYRRKTPSHHETRDITFEKSSSKPVGFKIQRGPSGGIFVSSVNDNSLALQAGLVIGDQLLEVCGINMRNANYDHASTVLRQCGDNLTMKVQYNPEKYNDHHDASSSTSINSSTLAVSPTHSSQTVSEKSMHKNQLSPSRNRSQGFSDIPTDGRRFLTLKKSNPNMIGPGFSFIGGNAVGIFVHEVFHECFVGGALSLQRGDHILEFNSVDFRSVTAEKALIELQRPCATMTMCVFCNFAKYNKIQNMPCDSFYIRANFDRPSESEEELGFQRDDVLFVENSLFNNQLGTWFAWLVNDQGTKLKGGIIPSRIRLEDEMVLRRTHSESWSLHESDELKGSRRGSASARRSFFRRKRHSRNNSKDSHEFGSLSDASINSDSVPVLDDSSLGYTQVEKIELKAVRPVVLLAPLAEALIRKLVAESPDKYSYCEPAPMRTSAATMEQSLAEGVLIDFWKEDDVYQCVRASAVKDICDRDVHCLLNVKPEAIERMHQSKVYPITILVRHKNSKQIRDIRDPQFLKERVSNKVAKDLFEEFQKVDQDYQQLFSASVQGGNMAEMCRHIQTVIASEQKKAIWVTTLNV